MLSMSCVWHAFESIHCCLLVTCSWLSFVMFNCVFVTFPCGILGHVWCLIVSIPDHCHLSYLVFAKQDKKREKKEIDKTATNHKLNFILTEYANDVTEG